MTSAEEMETVKPLEGLLVRNLTEESDLLRNASESTSPNVYVVAIKQMELIGIPIIVTIGLIGNTLSAVTFLSKSLRVLSCSLYLAARAISDSGFLVCIFVMWLQYVGAPVIHTQGVCQVEIFMSYLCGFMSVWFIVWVTVENYFRICQPFKVSAFCTVKKALFMITLTTLIGCMIYSVSTWTNGIVLRGQESVCFMIMEFKTISTVLTYGDCLITLILPCVIILVITALILLSILKTKRVKTERRRRGSVRLKATVSKMLLWVSLIFLLLNLPSHSVRLRVLFEMLTKQTTTASPLLFVSQRILQMIFYMSFAINFFIYVSLGPSFRSNFKVIFCPFFRRGPTRGAARENSQSRVSINGSSVNGNTVHLLVKKKSDSEER